MESNRMKVYARDPFAVDPLPKAFYHPSPEKKLTQTKRSTAISPSRQTEDRKQKQQYVDERVSPMDEIFLRGTNQYQPKPDQYETADDDDFNETWPSSERPSSLYLTGLEEGSPMDLARFQGIIDRFTNIKQTLKFSERDSPSSSPQRLRKPESAKHVAGARSDKPAKSGKPHNSEKKGAKKSGKENNTEDDEKPTGSVLNRYIERFRNSAPTSREEREMQKQSSSKDFWWLSPSGGSSKSDSHGHDQLEDEEKQTLTHPPLTAENLDKYSQWEQRYHKRSGFNVVPESPGDKKTIELQERAERLLEKSTSTVLSTDPAVSTEGLGSNMSDMSSLEEYPYRPAFTAYIDTRQTAGRRQDKARVPEYKPSALERHQPENDPLYQWRLRRKIEQAQEMPAKNVQTFDFLSKSEKEKKVDEQLDDFKRKLSEKPGQPVYTKPNRVEFTPAPQIAQTDRYSHPLPEPAQLASPQPLPEPARQRAQIASPILHRGRLGLDHQKDVDPHLHLMCDLLPCPHQTSYQEQLVNQLVADKNTGCDNLKQYLEAEKPDVEKRLHTDKETDIPDTDRYKPDSDMNKTRNKHSDSDSDVKNNKLKTVRIKASEDGNMHKRNRSSKQRGMDEEVSDNESGYREDRPARGERLPKPSQSSSPKVARRGVDEAIGQVVKDHLFSMSTSTVLSSVESLQPLASIDRLPPSSRHHMTKVPERPDTQAEESDQSDGEFSEDQLLQMLRRQRAMFEQQLHEIDSHLEKIEAR